MPIRTLFEDGASRYVAEERDDGASLWFFVHIPKTAGTSFRSQIARKLRPQRNIFVEPGSDRPHYQALADAARAFVADPVSRRCRFASGHLPHALVRIVTEARPRTRLIAMLRDPVTRVASSFHYQSSPAHPPHRDFQARFPSLEDFVADPISQNEMYRYLARTPAESPEDLCRRVSGTFAFVGLAETYDLSSRLLFTLLGEDTGPSLHLNRGENGREAALSPEAVAQIRRWNALDAEIFGYFAARYAAVAPDLEAYLDGGGRAEPTQEGPPMQDGPSLS